MCQHTRVEEALEIGCYTLRHPLPGLLGKCHIIAFAVAKLTLGRARKWVCAERQALKIWHVLSGCSGGQLFLFAELRLEDRVTVIVT